MNATLTTSSTRITWMDAARGIAVVLVVVLHGASVPMSTGAGFETWVEINRYLEPVRMPLLLFLSGMLLPRALRKPTGQYLSGKLRSLAWPIAVWMVLYGVLAFRKSVFDPGLWRSGDYLWFLFVVLGCYTIGMLCRWVPPLVLAIVMVLAVTVLDDSFMHQLDMKLLYYGTFFFAGAGLGRYVQRWAQVPIWVPVVLTVPAVWLTVLVVGDDGLRRGNIVAASISLLCLAVVLWFLPRLPSNRTMQVVEWLGQHSLVVYVTHFPVMVLVHRSVDYLNVAPWVHVGFCTAVTLIVVVVMVVLRPYTAWLYMAPARQHRSALAATGTSEPVGLQSRPRNSLIAGISWRA